jgi:carbamoyltransferase
VISSSLLEILGCPRDGASLIDTTDARWFHYKSQSRQYSLPFTRRDAEDVLSEPWPDFAAAAQHNLERGYERAARSAMGATHSRRLCLGGGVAMNCSANGRFLDSLSPDDVWLFPASGDAGLSVGAALLASRDLGKLERTRIESPYWGPSYDDAECERVLAEDSSIVYSRPANLASEVARFLANGNVVGWFQGRMEIGPRALGNRSILADPRTNAMRDKVNRVKGREMWRPLAPSILAERTSDWFERTPPNAFMLFAVQAREITKERAPAIVHVDGSARPQPVSRSLNERFYDVISEFERLTSVPILLNTSFNEAGEPIVCSPADALKTFRKTALDLLVLGPFIARKSS